MINGGSAKGDDGLNSEDSVQKLLHRFVAWARTQDDILAIMNQGSRARVDHQADEWSDLDLIVFTSNKEKYLNNSDWLQNVGRVTITFIEETAVGGERERRVLFEHGIDVDFSIISIEDLEELVDRPSPEVLDMIRRGVKVLFDKTGFSARLPEPSKIPVLKPQPSKEEFDQLVNDFLYHVVWTAKKLRRGELWTATACSDSYMTRKLLAMIEWHTLASTGWRADVWFNGRFMEEWADPKIVRALAGTFAHYDYEDVVKALLSTSELFLKLARETGEKLGYDTSISQAGPIMDLAREYLAQPR